MKVYYKNVQLNPTTETDYTDLANKPLVNGVELVGDQSTEQIKITWFGTQAEFDALGTYSPTTIYIIDDNTPVYDKNDYLDLANKPAINGQILTGKKLASDLKMYTKEEIQTMLASTRSVKVQDTYPTNPIANTMYYVGTSSEGYEVYLFDSNITEIKLGALIQKLYTSAGDPLVIDNHLNTISLKIDEDTLDVDLNNKLKMVKEIVRERLYPVGSIFMSATHTTASAVATDMGGTWVAWGTGRIPVGVDTSDTDFNTVEKTGGAKTHKLTVNEMAAHTHTFNTWDAASSWTAWGLNAGELRFASEDNRIGSTGGDQPHNNLQPYIVCYMYKRTA